MFRFLMLALAASCEAYTLSAMPRVTVPATVRANAPSMLLMSDDEFRQGTGPMMANRNGNGGAGWTGDGGAPAYGNVRATHQEDAGKDAFAFPTGQGMAVNRNGNG